MSRILWKIIRLPPKLLYRLGLGPLIGKLVLLLTTTGRKSGQSRVTPLQYEEIGGAIYIGSARGHKADWFRNIQANPNVKVQLKSRQFHAQAKPVLDTVQIANFLEVRLERHPRILGRIFRSQGLPPKPNRKQLEDYAAGKAMVIIQPEEHFK